MSDTLARIKKVTAEILKTDPNGIGDNARFVEDLGAESVQSVELIAGFELEFDIEMDEDDALTIKSVDGAVAFIDKRIAQK